MTLHDSYTIRISLERSIQLEVYDTILGNTQAKTIEPQKLETYKATSGEALKSNTYMATIRRG